MPILNRIKRAWAILTGSDELEQRALSFACAALEHVENTEWDITTVRLIADEACRRRLGHVDNMLAFSRTVDAIVLANSVPSPARKRSPL